MNKLTWRGPVWLGMGLLLTAGTMLCAQDTKPSAETKPATEPQVQIRPDTKWYQTVIDVKYADLVGLQHILDAVLRGASVRAESRLHAISIGSYDESQVKFAEEVIRRYDVPSKTAERKNIELTVYLLLTAPKGEAGTAVPQDLQGVVKQLQALFGYNDFRLLDSAVIRNREGMPGSATGNAGDIAPNTANSSAAPSTYRISYNDSSIVLGDKGSQIQLNQFRFDMRVAYLATLIPSQNGAASPGQWQYSDISFGTNLDIRDGQKAVVGKSKIDAAGHALVLVVSARAIE